MLEDNFCKSEEAAKCLEKELVETSSQLHYKENERETLMKELELWKTQVCCLTSEKEQLEVCMMFILIIVTVMELVNNCLHLARIFGFEKSID